MTTVIVAGIIVGLFAFGIWCSRHADQANGARRCLFRHAWRYIGDPGELDGGGCTTNGLRYECSRCGKTKDRWY